MEDDTKPTSQSKKILLIVVPLLMVLLFAAFFISDWLSVPADFNNRELPTANSLIQESELNASKLSKISSQLAQLSRSPSQVEGNRIISDRIFITMKCGDEFLKLGAYSNAIDCYQAVSELARVSAALVNPLDVARCYAKLAECYLVTGNREQAYSYATAAFRAFNGLQAINDQLALSTLGILLELSSDPGRLSGGDIYLDALKHSPIARAPTDIQAFAYMRAAHYLKARINSGQHEIFWDNRNASLSEIEQIYLRSAMEAWKNSEQRGFNNKAILYNQASIYNQLGLLAAQRGEFNAAQRDFQDAVQRLNSVGDTKNMARVLLNLSDLALKQSEFGRYIELHNQAKRMWTVIRD